MLVATKVIRLLIVRDCHAVALAALVLAPLELVDDEIGMHAYYILYPTLFGQIEEYKHSFRLYED